MSLENHESTLFYFPLQPMGRGAQHAVSPVIDSNDMSLDFAQNPEMGLGFSQSSSAYSSGPFQPMGGLWANDIDPNMAPFINDNVVDSSPLSQASIEPLQLQNTSPSVANRVDPNASPFINDDVVTSSPLSHTSTEPPQLQIISPRVVQVDNNIQMEVNGKQVLFRTAQKQWDLESILRACNQSQDQHRAFKKKLSRLGRVTREGHRKYISLRDGILLIRAVGLEAELAGMIAMLPESVPPDEENFLLRYQRGPQKNHLVYNNHEIAYKPEAGLIKATDLVKIANVSRRTLFAYFTRFPKMKKEVVKGGAHSGSYILLQDVPTLCRAFNIDLEVYYRLREKFPSSDRGPLTELNVNSSENLASNPEVSMTGEPPPTHVSSTNNPSSPFCEDYFGPDAEFTFHGDENIKPTGDSSSRVASRSDIPRNRISPIDANTISQASHGSNANHVSHTSFGSLAGYESSGPQTSHSSHTSSGSHEFPSSFYRTRGSLVLDLNLEDYTLSRYYDDFTRRSPEIHHEIISIPKLAVIHLGQTTLHSHDILQERPSPNLYSTQLTPRKVRKAMGTFQNKKFRSSASMNGIAAKYRSLMNRHPFLTFGLPFMTVIVAGSFVLTPATAIRYERYDRKVRQMTKDEELNVRRAPRKVDMREEYYKLAGRDLENWEQKRVERLKGESDGILR
ncbi:unnamed protein product [Clonostachys chloroleuca]|uniref:Cytochrome c oxidase assembly protein COX16, mitochondrial n=1 Tax=Clonostachys chloroleuca TaxID=1926264 RepID=A0AA35MG52_9HYPO|nr:unnamed protein product [Clonostachys chloroleuca]